MADAALWIAWGLPSTGRERQALDLLKRTARGYLDGLVRDGRIDRHEIAILRPQSTELGGFILIAGDREHLTRLRTESDFASWVTQIQLVADRVGMVDAWLGDGIDEAIALYEDALREIGDDGS